MRWSGVCGSFEFMDISDEVKGMTKRCGCPHTLSSTNHSPWGGNRPTISYKGNTNYFQVK
jgi:hypothetical protein